MFKIFPLCTLLFYQINRHCHNIQKGEKHSGKLTIQLKILNQKKYHVILNFDDNDLIKKLVEPLPMSHQRLKFHKLKMPILVRGHLAHHLPILVVQSIAPNISSGARQQREQMYETFGSPLTRCLALPKSHNLSTPVSGSNNKF